MPHVLLSSASVYERRLVESVRVRVEVMWLVQSTWLCASARSGRSRSVPLGRARRVCRGGGPPPAVRRAQRGARVSLVTVCKPPSCNSVRKS